MLTGISLALSARFDDGLPIARGVSPELLGWFFLVANLIVAAFWLAGGRSVGASSLAVPVRAPVAELWALFRGDADIRHLLAWSLALNLPFTITGQIWHSYDFSTHVFFASHYQQSWWSLWEPRWFEGFDVASYPALTHQLAALVGWIVGIENAINLLTAFSIVVFPLLVHGLVRLHFSAVEARRAAALALVAP